MGDGISIDGINVSVGSETRNLSVGRISSGQVESNRGDLLDQLSQSLVFQKQLLGIDTKRFFIQNEFNYLFVQPSSVSISKFFDKKRREEIKEEILLYDKALPPGKMGNRSKVADLSSLQFEAQENLLQWKAFGRREINYGEFFLETEFVQKE